MGMGGRWGRPENATKESNECEVEDWLRAKGANAGQADSGVCVKKVGKGVGRGKK